MSDSESGPERSAQPRAARSRGILGRIALAAFGLASAGLVRLIGATWRVETLGVDPRDTQARRGGALIAAVFHESMIPCAWLYRNLGYTVAVSRSRDGDLIRATLLSLGYAEPARGSSSRGGSVALRGLRREVEGGTTAAVLVDGPRGPARVAKTGVVALARMADRPIQPIGFSARPALRLASWDQSLIPLPFARVVVAYGEPIAVDTRDPTDDVAEQATARQVERALTDLHHGADQVLLRQST